LKRIIYIQSCFRRRLARAELKMLKIEARSASQYKEVPDKLKNKVIRHIVIVKQEIIKKKYFYINS